MTDDKIKEKLQQYFIIKGQISIENGLVSCTGNVNLKKDPKIEGLPVKFKEVGGDFNCYDNQLKSLAGAPQSIRGSFNCYNNQLTSLIGAPQSVGGDFDCYNNQLTSLVGAPQSVGGDFTCSSNKLTSLRGAPQSVGGCFYCNDNQLTSLAGAPRYVGGGFYCNDNQLTSLAGAPQYVGEVFYLTYGKNLALLPLLMIKGCKQVEFRNADDKIQHKSLSEILNRYLGIGTRGMLACAEEMIEAGYGSNATL